MLYLERRPHHALTRLHQSPGATTIAALTRGIGVSPRRLSQHFREQIGVSPQTLLPHPALPAGGPTHAPGR
jgi:transcriptional regulator GlxA family with amidase domain